MVPLSPPPQSGSSYSFQTKERIIEAVRTAPGRTGKEIATSLRLDKSKVNSFLYGEGKRKYGLIEKQWRWWLSSSASSGKESQESAPYRIVLQQPLQFSLPSSSRQQKRTSETSICACLAAMGRSDATIKIRGMSLEGVELAFQEEEYAQLDEYCQVELATRRSILLQQTPAKDVTRSVTYWRPFLLILFVVVCFLTIKEINNGHKEAPSTSQVLSGGIRPRLDLKFKSKLLYVRKDKIEQLHSGSVLGALREISFSPTRKLADPQKSSPTRTFSYRLRSKQLHELYRYRGQLDKRSENNLIERESSAASGCCGKRKKSGTLQDPFQGGACLCSDRDGHGKQVDTLYWFSQATDRMGTGEGQPWIGTGRLPSGTGVA